MRKPVRFRVLNTLSFTGTLDAGDPRLVASAGDEMHTVRGPVELTDLDEALKHFQAAINNRKSVLEQLRDERSGIDAYFVAIGKPDPSGWVRIDSEGRWSEVDADWVKEYSAGPVVPPHFRQYRRVLMAVTYLEELYAPPPGTDIAIEYFILRLRREYVMAILAIEGQDWETAMLRIFEAGRLKQIIDERPRLQTVKTGSKVRRGLRTRRDAQNQRSARAVESRRENIRDLLTKTKLTGGALVRFLSKKTGASRRTIQRDLQALR